MKSTRPVISGIGVVAPSGAGKEKFWKALEQGKDFIQRIETLPTDCFTTTIAGEIKGFKPEKILGPKNLRNLPKSTLFVMAAAQLAISDAKLTISDSNTDDIGVCTGTTFPHVGSIVEFDREVFKQGIDFSNPAYFPSTVINAASSQVSIRNSLRKQKFVQQHQVLGQSIYKEATHKRPFAEDVCFVLDKGGFV